MSPSRANDNPTGFSATQAPSQRVSWELDARETTGDELISCSLTLPGATETFLRGESGLTTGIAFGLSRVTGMSATYWLGVEQRWQHDASASTGSAQILEDSRQQLATERLTDASSTKEEKLRVALTAGAFTGHTLELSSALVKTALQTQDPLVFRAAAEATAAHNPEITRIIAHARLSDHDLTIAATALLTLYGTEPGAALRRAYECLNGAETPEAIRSSATEVLKLYYKTQRRELVLPAVNGEPQWIKDARDDIRNQITSGDGDPYLIQKLGYDFTPIAEACRTFLNESDTAKRQAALRTVAPRSVNIGVCIAFLGARDSDPQIRADSLAVLRIRNLLAAINKARRLLSDSDQRVSGVAQRALESISAEAQGE